jgi:hypothetical protein
MGALAKPTPKICGSDSLGNRGPYKNIFKLIGGFEEK